MKCILLVRVSTEAQTYDEQEKELFDLAQQYGYSHNEIKAVAYKESAIKLKEEERAGLNEMKALIDTGEYDCVFAWEISRIARKKKILFSILDYLTERKIQLIIKEPSIVLLKENGEINEGAETIFTLFAQIAESEMRNKVARFQRAKKEGYNKGKYMGGVIKLGYKVDDNGYWTIDEEKAQIIRDIFNMYNSGEYSILKLGEELKSRGYFSHLTMFELKGRIYTILTDASYVGERITNNILPPIIDRETWEKSVKKRKANSIIPRARGKYLLTPLIRCICGKSYTVGKDTQYICAQRNNVKVDKFEHSPSIGGNLIESLVWYVALQEFHQEMFLKKEDVKKEYEKEIAIYLKKIECSEKLINSTRSRRTDLDDAYFVYARLTKERYEELAKKQNLTISEELDKIKNYKLTIKRLEQQIKNATTFDEMFDSLGSSFDELKNGTDYETMKKIVHRYIKEINISAIEGKRPRAWKKILIKTVNEEFNRKKIEELEALGMKEATIVLKNEFYADIYNRKIYWDEELKHEVPFVYLNRYPKKTKHNQK